jgi:hypothetical protein
MGREKNSSNSMGIFKIQIAITTPPLTTDTSYFVYIFLTPSGVDLNLCPAPSGRGIF